MIRVIWQFKVYLLRLFIAHSPGFPRVIRDVYLLRVNDKVAGNELTGNLIKFDFS